ncbi:MAG: YezD family protein [Candidatus Scalindua sp.]
MESTRNSNKIPNEKNIKQVLSIIEDLLRNIKYGYIQITIQDSRVVQIDKTEKFRFSGQTSKKTVKTEK